MRKTAAFTGAALFLLPLFAKIELGTPFTDRAVLQRGMKVPVWGKATPGNEVTVSFAGQKFSSIAAADGGWRIDFDPMEASKECRTLSVTECEPGWFGATVDEVEVRDVLVGEVWFASGQSNMDCPIWGGNSRYRDANGALVTEMTRLPNVRYCKNARKWSVEALPSKAEWRTMTPENLRSVPFSAVAYYYARELYLALDVPIGIVDSSWGGTNIDAWTPRGGYADCDAVLRETAAYVPVGNDKFARPAWKNAWDWGAPISSACQQPTVIWNGMVASWCPMAMRGMIWYQGCHNNGQAPSYCARMHALYNGWSRAFGNPQLSFYFAQLAPFYHNWFGLVQAQARFAAEEPHAAMAVTADVGNFDDVHPNRKEIVAKRLVAHALRHDYGFDIPETDSPVFKSVKFDGAKAELTFDHAKSWYVYAPDRSLDAAFELAGADGAWHAAKIANLKTHRNGKGEEVVDPIVEEPVLVLTSAQVAAPVRARYMGKDRTAGTVYNEMSLPLGPFEAR